jgi:hypothetical protein
MLVKHPHRIRDVPINLVHEFQDSILSNLIICSVQGVQSRPTDDRNLIARELVETEELCRKKG